MRESSWVVGSGGALAVGVVLAGLVHGQESPPAREPEGATTAAPWSGGPARLPAGVMVGSKVGEYVNARDGSVLVWVAPGMFRMGSAETPSSSTGREDPVHEVRLTRGYFLGKTEVTWARYRVFCQRTGRQAPPQELRTANRPFVPGDEHPVFDVTWDDAAAYCAWAGLRLPTEAEWELAARGTDGRAYPWGSQEPGATRCNRGSGDYTADVGDAADGHLYTAPVGSFADDAAPCGALDLAGNVMEWVSDWYESPAAGAQIDPTGPESGKFRVYRGGSWRTGATDCRATRRSGSSPSESGSGLGFRVARSSEDR